MIRSLPIASCLSLALLLSGSRARSDELRGTPTTFDLGSPRLSAELIHIRLRGLGLEYSKNGQVIKDLSLAVVGSPRAEELARQADNQATTGHLLVYTGLAIAVPCGVLGIWMAFEYLSNPLYVLYPLGPIIALLLGTAVGLGMEIAGMVLINSSRAHEEQAIDAYNADLVDRRLIPPAARALPQS